VAEDFDLTSSSGCSNVTSPTHGGNTYSIWLSDGWGAFQFNDFTGLSMDFYAQTYGAGGTSPDTLAVIIGGKEGTNTLTIEFAAPEGDKTRVRVTDEFDGDTNEEEEIIAETIYSEWAKVSITIRPTDDKTDGTTKELTVLVNRRSAIDAFPLLSGELSENIGERSFREVEFGVASEYDDVYVSEISIDTTTYSETGGLNVTFILLGLGSTILILVFVFKRQTIARKTAEARDKISQTTK